MKISDWNWLGPLMNAAQAGATLQFLDSRGEWVDIDPADHYSFHLGENHYRIKPPAPEYRMLLHPDYEGLTVATRGVPGFNWEPREFTMSRDGFKWIGDWMPMPEEWVNSLKEEQ